MRGVSSKQSASLSRITRGDFVVQTIIAAIFRTNRAGFEKFFQLFNSLFQFACLPEDSETLERNLRFPKTLYVYLLMISFGRNRLRQFPGKIHFGVDRRHRHSCFAKHQNTALKQIKFR